VVNDAGPCEERKLREMAKESYNQKTKHKDNSTTVVPENKKNNEANDANEMKPALADIPEIRIDTGTSYVTAL
jgi:hypothetical protein